MHCVRAILSRADYMVYALGISYSNLPPSVTYPSPHLALGPPPPNVPATPTVPHPHSSNKTRHPSTPRSVLTSSPPPPLLPKLLPLLTPRVERTRDITLARSVSRSLRNRGNRHLRGRALLDQFNRFHRRMFIINNQRRHRHRHSSRTPRRDIRTLRCRYTVMS